MSNRVRGFPRICKCGEAIRMGTSRTAKNPGRLFHSCPHGSEEGLREKTKQRIMTSNCCAISKILKEPCSPNCISAPYFPSDDTRFEDVHKIFGAKNVRRILNNLPSLDQREIAANSLRDAAEARRRDPISGYHGMILHYQSILNNVEQDTNFTMNELETFVGPDQVPKYFDLRIPDDFLTTPDSLDSYIEKIKNLTTTQKNQLMQLWKREDQKMGDGHGADGASTYICWAIYALRSINDTHQQIPALPEYQNQQ